MCGRVTVRLTGRPGSSAERRHVIPCWPRQGVTLPLGGYEVGYCHWCGTFTVLNSYTMCKGCLSRWLAAHNMRDLLIITPTRGRLAGAQRLVDAVAATCTSVTDLVLAVDDDDDSYKNLTGNFAIIRGPRDTCAGWTNKIAREQAAGYRAVASIGDDHEPITHGWDTLLLNAIDDMGGTGIAYGNDTQHGEDVPTAAVISTDIVQKLGWVFEPTMTHFYADLVWKEIAWACCLKYLPDVIIKHYNPNYGTAPMDDTYTEARMSYDDDGRAYAEWGANQRAADIATVRALAQARRR